MAKKLMVVETLDQANTIVRNLVRDHALALGITDWKFVNETIRDNRHIYRVWPEEEFDDEVGDLIDFYGYAIWELDRG